MKHLLLLALLLFQDGFEAKVDAILPRLNAEDLKVRSAAVEDLTKLALSDPSTARRVLAARIATQSAEDVKAGLRAALAALPVLELKLEVEGEAKAGQLVKLKVRIRNLSDVDQVAVRCLDGSEGAWRYPYYTASITPAVAAEKGMRCKMTNALSPADLITIKPGAEGDPLKNGFGPDVLRSWKPEKAGTYVVSLVIDMSATETAKWNGKSICGDAAQDFESMVRRITKVKLEAKLEVTVVDP